MDANVNFDPREDAYSKPLDKIDVSDPRLYYDDIWRPYFERLRREDPVHFTPDSPVWAVLGGHQVPRHRAGRGEPQGVLLVGRGRRHHDQRCAEGHGAHQLHPHGPAGARRSAARGQLHGQSDHAGEDGDLDPRAHQHGAGRLAARRDVQLGGTGLDRTHVDDAGDAVRLSDRGQGAADPLVGHVHLRHQRARRAGAVGGGALRRTDALRRAHERDLGGAREEAEELRRDLDHGARRGDQQDDAAPAHGDSDPVPGRRQRHDAQLDVGRLAGAEPLPRSVPEAAREPGAGHRARYRRSCAGRRR